MRRDGRVGAPSEIAPSGFCWTLASSQAQAITNAIAAVGIHPSCARRMFMGTSRSEADLMSDLSPN
jgi:hypothetical protein